jgi:RNA polymerase sigma-70 factor (ECF subfamily)
MGTGDQSDPEALLRQAHAGDRTALGQLLALYENYLLLLARLQIGRRLQSKVDAADLVQETFLEAHRHFAQFRGTTEEGLVSWLRQILAANLANLVRRYCGTRRRDIRLERELAAELDQSSRLLDRALVAPGSTPSQQAVRREQAVLLADALRRLRDDYREVLILRHLEELSFPELARRLGRSVGSVEKQWVRGLAELRRSLGGCS